MFYNNSPASLHQNSGYEAWQMCILFLCHKWGHHLKEKGAWHHIHKEKRNFRHPLYRICTIDRWAGSDCSLEKKFTHMPRYCFLFYICISSFAYFTFQILPACTYIYIRMKYWSLDQLYVFGLLICPHLIRFSWMQDPW
jgi:hypothetical protein